MVVTAELKNQIQAALQRNGFSGCPCCKGRAFSIADGFSMIAIQTDPKAFSIGGKSIPCAVVICDGCAIVSQHALKALGINI